MVILCPRAREFIDRDSDAIAKVSAPVLRRCAQTQAGGQSRYRQPHCKVTRIGRVMNEVGESGFVGDVIRQRQRAR